MTSGSSIDINLPPVTIFRACGAHTHCWGGGGGGGGSKNGGKSIKKNPTVPLNQKPPWPGGVQVGLFG